MVRQVFVGVFLVSGKWIKKSLYPLFTNLFLIHLPETKKIRALDAYQQKEMHRNRTPICAESFAGKMVGARVKCSLSVPLDSSNSVEKLCDSWVWVRRYVALVVSVPIPLRTQQTGVPTRRKAFLRNYGKQKSGNEHLTQTIHDFELHLLFIVVK